MSFTDFLTARAQQQGVPECVVDYRRLSRLLMRGCLKGGGRCDDACRSPLLPAASPAAAVPKAPHLSAAAAAPAAAAAATAAPELRRKAHSQLGAGSPLRVSTSTSLRSLSFETACDSESMFYVSSQSSLADSDKPAAQPGGGGGGGAAGAAEAAEPPSPCTESPTEEVRIEVSVPSPAAAAAARGTSQQRSFDAAPLPGRPPPEPLLQPTRRSRSCPLTRPQRRRLSGEPAGGAPGGSPAGSPGSAGVVDAATAAQFERELLESARFVEELVLRKAPLVRDRASCVVTGGEEVRAYYSTLLNPAAAGHVAAAAAAAAAAATSSTSSSSSSSSSSASAAAAAASAAASAKPALGYRTMQEVSILLVQIRYAHEDATFLLWLMALNTIAVGRILQQYELHRSSSTGGDVSAAAAPSKAARTFEPKEWFFMKEGPEEMLALMSQLEVVYSAVAEVAPGCAPSINYSTSTDLSLCGDIEHMFGHYARFLPDWDLTPKAAAAPAAAAAAEAAAAREAHDATASGGSKESLAAMATRLYLRTIKKREKRRKQQQEQQQHQFFSQALLQAYDLKEKVGAGTYGVVVAAERRSTGRRVAVKTISEAWSHPVLGQRAYREVRIMQQAAHPHIMSLLDVFVSDKDEQLVHLVMPFIPHTCEELMIDRKLTLRHKKQFVLQLLSALAYLHARGVVHRDVKLSNILVDDTPQLFLSDFGLARTLECGQPAHQSHTLHGNGDYIQTQWYRAPEALLCSSDISAAADLWSTGCIVVELLTGIPLFPGQDDVHQLELVLATMSAQPGGLPHGSLTQLLQEKLAGDARSASVKLTMSKTLEVVVRDCWDSGAAARVMDKRGNGQRDAPPSPLCLELVRALLQMNPGDRLPARRALRHRWFLEEPALPRSSIEGALTDSARFEGEDPMSLDLPCGILHSACEYRNAICDKQVISYKRKLQEIQVERCKAAVTLQRFWRWRTMRPVLPCLISPKEGGGVGRGGVGGAGAGLCDSHASLVYANYERRAEEQQRRKPYGACSVRRTEVGGEGAAAGAAGVAGSTGEDSVPLCSLCPQRRASSAFQERVAEPPSHPAALRKVGTAAPAASAAPCGRAGGRTTDARRPPVSPPLALGRDGSVTSRTPPLAPQRQGRHGRGAGGARCQPGSQTSSTSSRGGPRRVCRRQLHLTEENNLEAYCGTCTVS